MRRTSGLWAACALFLLVVAARNSGLPLVAEVDNSKGLKAGDAVLFEGNQIGEVDSVGFGERDVVEIKLTIDADESERIHKGGLFVVNEGREAKRPTLEYFVIDPKSPQAGPGTHIAGVKSVAEVWLRRGRINADELSRSMSQGVDQLKKNIEELRSSPEWAKFKDQVARLSAQLTVTGSELTRLLNDQLPKLQKELDQLYLDYEREVERAQKDRTPAP